MALVPKAAVGLIGWREAANDPKRTLATLRIQSYIQSGKASVV